jgi:histidine triad (HIT) family protein
MAETDSGCVFCRIALHETGSHVIYVDDLVFAFLDRGPIRAGHTQIIRKSHYDYFDGLPLPVATRIAVGQKLVKVMKGLYGVPRMAPVFTGGDIAHAHTYAVPMHEAAGITSTRFIAEDRLTFRARPPASEEELQEQARLLVAGLQSY